MFIYKIKHILVYSDWVKYSENYSRMKKSNTWDITGTTLRPRSF